MLLVIVSQRNFKFSLMFLFTSDNQILQAISQTQNRAAKDKKMTPVDFQNLWSPLAQLGEQLSLALVNSQTQQKKTKAFSIILFFYLETLQSTTSKHYTCPTNE